MLGSVVGRLTEGPLVLIGDVHGELEALEALLARPELDPTGDGSFGGRTLCFLGDLVDRGPDSPGVLRRVRGLIDSGRAVSLLGNHELNLLRQDKDPKGDNRWFRDEPRQLPGGELLPERRVASDLERSELMDMLADLPVALERSDLRLVHACWDARAIASLASWPRNELVERHETGLVEAVASLRAAGTLKEARALERDLERRFPFGASDSPPPPTSELIASRELAIQNSEPLRVVTSGREVPLEPGTPSFAAGGKWRHTRREPWWRTYDEAPSVVMGHYWRSLERPQQRRLLGPPDPFHDEPDSGPLTTLGAGEVHCIDYSVGRRFLDRLAGRAKFGGHLAALLWPERVLVLDH
ncbi:MAG: metallophosphoesterase [Planctomycetota bacterium]|nr:metallophosphoesterase [Planctomycetota bacterium]